MAKKTLTPSGFEIKITGNRGNLNDIYRGKDGYDGKLLEMLEQYLQTDTPDHDEEIRIRISKIF